MTTKTGQFKCIPLLAALCLFGLAPNCYASQIRLVLEEVISSSGVDVASDSAEGLLPDGLDDQLDSEPETQSASDETLSSDESLAATYR